MQEKKRSKYNSLDTDNVLKAAVAKKLKEMKTKQKDKSIGARTERFNREVKYLKHNAQAMFSNYGTSVIIAGVSHLDDHDFFPSFVCASGMFNCILYLKTSNFKKKNRFRKNCIDNDGQKRCSIGGSIESSCIF